MEYITGQELVSQIRLELRSYDESGKIVESIIYAELDRLLNAMGVRILPIHSTVLIVDDFKAKLPSDFISLLSAFTCSKIETEYIDPAWETYEKDVCDVPICKTRCDYCWNENNDLFQVYMRTKTHKWTVKHTEILSIDSSSDFCNDCVNPKAKNKFDISIKNGLIHTQFRQAKIFIEYRAKSDSGGDLLIPEAPQVIKYLKEYLKVYILKDIFYNYDMDQSITQRIQMMEANLPLLEAAATTFVRFNGVGDFYTLRSLLRKNYKYNSNELYRHVNNRYRYY